MKTRQAVGPDVVALVLGMLGTVAWQWTLFASRLDRIPGDRGDARVYVYLVEHWYQAFRGHAEMLSPGMFYPVQGTIGYTETMFVHALPYSVFRLLGLDMFTALAVPLIVFSFLNYASCYFLLRRVIGVNVVASVAGAMFFAFNSPRFNHIGHYSYQAAFFLPLVAACVVRFVQRRDLTERQAFGLLAAAAISLTIQFVISPYQGWFTGFWSCLLLALIFSMRRPRHVALEIIRKFWRSLAGAALVLAVVLLPPVLIYTVVAGTVQPRYYSDALRLTPDAWSLIQMGTRNYIWDRVAGELTRVHSYYSSELYIAIGLVPSLALLALVVWSVRTVVREVRRPKSDAIGPDMQRLVLALMILAVALLYAIAIKYPGGGSPWQVVYRFVPGADAMRAIARHVMVLTLPMSIAFALVVHRAAQKISKQGTELTRLSLSAALAGVLAFGVFEQFGRAPSFSASAELSRLRVIAASLPDNCKAFYAAAAPGRKPVKHEDQIDAMLVSVMRGVPTFNGYSGSAPPGWALREVEAPDYELRIAEWISEHGVTGAVCRLEISD